MCFLGRTKCSFKKLVICRGLKFSDLKVRCGAWNLTADNEANRQEIQVKEFIVHPGEFEYTFALNRFWR